MRNRFTVSMLCGLIAAYGAPVQAQQTSASGEQAERASLCAQSIALAGVESDLDARVRSALVGIHSRLDAIVAPQDASLQAYYRAVETTLASAKAPILAELQQSCVEAFTPDELRGINAFYASDAGRAWLDKGRSTILPTLERAVAEAVPRLREEVQDRYCAERGCR